jgi:hypothetical protein
MAYTGRTPAAAPLTSGDIPDGSVTPDDLSTGAPSWDASGNVSLDGAVVINESGADVDFRIESDTDANAFFLEGSSGNVGIGTSSPTTLLHVQGTNSGILVDTSTAYTPVIKASGALSDLKLSSVGNGGHLVLDAPGTTSVMTMSTNGSERMRIDSSGRVTMPYQPMFSAGRNAGHVAKNNVYIFNSASVNVGSHYNTTNGRFTAPVAGHYLFSTRLMTDTNGGTVGHVSYDIRKNGSRFAQAYTYRDTAGSHRAIAATQIVYLAVNDYVDVYVNDSFTTSGLWYGNSTLYNNFSGFLIG